MSSAKGRRIIQEQLDAVKSGKHLGGRSLHHQERVDMLLNRSHSAQRPNSTTPITTVPKSVRDNAEQANVKQDTVIQSAKSQLEKDNLESGKLLAARSADRLRFLRSQTNPDPQKKVVMLLQVAKDLAQSMEGGQEALQFNYVRDIEVRGIDRVAIGDSGSNLGFINETLTDPKIAEDLREQMARKIEEVGGQATAPPPVQMKRKSLWGDVLTTDEALARFRRSIDDNEDENENENDESIKSQLSPKSFRKLNGKNGRGGNTSDDSRDQSMAENPGSPRGKLTERHRASNDNISREFNVDNLKKLARGLNDMLRACEEKLIETKKKSAGQAEKLDHMRFELGLIKELREKGELDDTRPLMKNLTLLEYEREWLYSRMHHFESRASYAESIMDDIHRKENSVNASQEYIRRMEAENLQVRSKLKELLNYMVTHVRKRRRHYHRTIQLCENNCMSAYDEMAEMNRRVIELEIQHKKDQMFIESFAQPNPEKMADDLMKEVLFRRDRVPKWFVGIRSTLDRTAKNTATSMSEVLQGVSPKLTPEATDAITKFAEFLLKFVPSAFTDVVVPLLQNMSPFLDVTFANQLGADLDAVQKDPMAQYVQEKFSPPPPLPTSILRQGSDDYRKQWAKLMAGLTTGFREISACFADMLTEVEELRRDIKRYEENLDGQKFKVVEEELLKSQQTVQGLRDEWKLNQQQLFDIRDALKAKERSFAALEESYATLKSDYNTFKTLSESRTSQMDACIDSLQVDLQKKDRELEAQRRDHENHVADIRKREARRSKVGGGGGGGGDEFSDSFGMLSPDQVASVNASPLHSPSRSRNPSIAPVGGDVLVFPMTPTTFTKRTVSSHVQTDPIEIAEKSPREKKDKTGKSEKTKPLPSPRNPMPGGQTPREPKTPRDEQFVVPPLPKMTPEVQSQEPPVAIVVDVAAPPAKRRPSTPKTDTPPTSSRQMLTDPPPLITVLGTDSAKPTPRGPPSRVPSARSNRKVEIIGGDPVTPSLSHQVSPRRPCTNQGTMCNIMKDFTHSIACQTERIQSAIRRPGTTTTVNSEMDDASLFDGYEVIDGPTEDTLSIGRPPTAQSPSGSLKVNFQFHSPQRRRVLVTESTVKSLLKQVEDGASSKDRALSANPERVAVQPMSTMRVQYEHQISSLKNVVIGLQQQLNESYHNNSLMRREKQALEEKILLESRKALRAVSSAKHESQFLRDRDHVVHVQQIQQIESQFNKNLENIRERNNALTQSIKKKADTLLHRKNQELQRALSAQRKLNDTPSNSRPSTVPDPRNGIGGKDDFPLPRPLAVPPTRGPPTPATAIQDEAHNVEENIRVLETTFTEERDTMLAEINRLRRRSGQLENELQNNQETNEDQIDALERALEIRHNAFMRSKAENMMKLKGLENQVAELKAKLAKERESAQQQTIANEIKVTGVEFRPSNPLRLKDVPVEDFTDQGTHREVTPKDHQNTMRPSSAKAVLNSSVVRDSGSGGLFGKFFVETDPFEESSTVARARTPRKVAPVLVSVGTQVEIITADQCISPQLIVTLLSSCLIVHQPLYEIMKLLYSKNHMAASTPAYVKVPPELTASTKVIQDVITLHTRQKEWIRAMRCILQNVKVDLISDTFVGGEVGEGEGHEGEENGGGVVHKMPVSRLPFMQPVTSKPQQQGDSALSITNSKSTKPSSANKAVLNFLHPLPATDHVYLKRERDVSQIAGRVHVLQHEKQAKVEEIRSQSRMSELRSRAHSLVVVGSQRPHSSCK
eukprot:PhF_6_TR8009/c0_g1_i1/m.12410